VEVNTVGEANDVNGHPSQEFDVQIDAENSNVDEPDIIHDSFKTNDANAEQTESIVDDDAEQNDVSQNIIQGLQNKTVSDDVEMEKQMRQLMLVVMLIKIVMIELMEKIPSLIKAWIYLFKVVLK
jgi:hypothetical protein